MNLRERCEQLVSEYRDGTRSAARAAQKELIKICEPAIRLRYGIAKKYRQPIDEITRDYDPSSGKIESVYELKNDGVVFLYRDVCTSDDGTKTEYKAYIDMPMSWLDEGSEVEFESECRDNRIEFLKKSICVDRALLEEMEDELSSILSE